MTSVNNLFGSSFAKYMIETANSWPLLLVMTAFAFIFTIIYFFLLKWITKPLIYVSILMIFASGVIFTILIGFKANTLIVGTSDYMGTVAASVAIGLGTLLFLVIICCQWRNIQIGSSIMECSGQFLGTHLRLVFVPIFITIIILPIILWWAVTIIFLFSTGTPVFVSNSFF